MSFSKHYRFIRMGLLGAGAAILAGCASVGPNYQQPTLRVPAQWQAAVPHQGNLNSLVDWWQSFDDPILTELLSTAEKDNPTLSKATAAIASARASRAQAGSASWPTLDVGASATRSGSLRSSNGAAVATSSAGATSALGEESNGGSSVGVDASWEIDLFGAVRRNQEAAHARLQSSQADWHDARVSLAAEVATEYVNYRGCQLLVENYQTSAESLRKTAESTAVAVRAGLVAPADGALSNASSANAAATLNSQQAECELTVKSLVALTGLDEPQLRAKLASEKATIPTSAMFGVTALPVQLLSQRPDLVAAERSLAAASADIGVAEANRYPRLSLLGSVTVGSTNVGGTSVSTSPWSFGPSLSLPLFNGGSLRAKVDSARASYESALAGYQSAVRNAVKETEQSLVRLDFANRRSEAVVTSARDYQRYYESAYQSWRAGSISLLTLEEARRNALQAQQSAITVQRDRVLYGIALYKALGGGWQTTEQTALNQTTNTTGASQ